MTAYTLKEKLLNADPEKVWLCVISGLVAFATASTWLVLAFTFPPYVCTPTFDQVVNHLPCR